MVWFFSMLVYVHLTFPYFAKQRVWLRNRQNLANLPIVSETTEDATRYGLRKSRQMDVGDLEIHGKRHRFQKEPWCSSCGGGGGGCCCGCGCGCGCACNCGCDCSCGCGDYWETNPTKLVYWFDFFLPQSVYRCRRTSDGAVVDHRMSKVDRKRLFWMRPSHVGLSTYNHAGIYVIYIYVEINCFSSYQDKYIYVNYSKYTEHS